MPLRRAHLPWGLIVTLLGLGVAFACDGGTAVPVDKDQGTTGGVPATGGSSSGGSFGTGGAASTGGTVSGTGGAFTGGSYGGSRTGGSQGSGGSTAPGPVRASTLKRKLDLVFMVDDSSSMAPLQTQLTRNFSAFMDALSDPAAGGLPDIHIGVISSDRGAGRSIVPGCMRIGGDLGTFQNASRNPVGCEPPRDHYIIDGISPDGSRATNFSGDVTQTLSCIALLGQLGCGFESQFGSVLAALSSSSLPAGNEGFLRSDALLAVVMFTNEDDCSVPPDSDLFNPNMTDPARDPYGALQSYRCTEFGLECDQPMPHFAPATAQVLTHCHSKEDGRLLKVSDFVVGLRQTKADPNDIFFAVLTAAPPPSSDQAAITVTSTMVGGVAAPMLVHAPGCEGYSGDSAIRIRQAAQLLGGEVESICSDDYAPAMKNIAAGLNRRLGNACLPQRLARNADGSPGCVVQDVATGKVLPSCDSVASPPCWQPVADVSCQGSSTAIAVRQGGGVTGNVLDATCQVCQSGTNAAGCF